MRRAIAALVALMACSKPDAAKQSSAPAAATAAVPATAPGSACPSVGTWSECSVLYRLERAGVAPKIDSGATPSEKQLGGRTLMLKIGASARLEVHLYADSAARVADGAKIDRKALVSGTGPQTIKRERTLIESANLIGLLSSINAHQRERVSDALTAGPPQPTEPVMLKPVGIAPR